MDIIANQIGIPARSRQKLLHPVRRAVTRCLGKLPAVLPLQRRHQATKIAQSTTMRFQSKKCRPSHATSTVFSEATLPHNSDCSTSLPAPSRTSSDSGSMH